VAHGERIGADPRVNPDDPRDITDLDHLPAGDKGQVSECVGQ
jgi:hypothetical protein